MKKVEKIWADLSAKQVALSEEQQVELASAKEIKSMASKVDSLQKKVYKQLDVTETKGDVAYRATLDLSNSVDELKDLTSKLKKDFDIVSKQAKELGMNPKEVPALASSLDIINTAEQAVGYGERGVKTQTKGFKI